MVRKIPPYNQTGEPPLTHHSSPGKSPHASSADPDALRGAGHRRIHCRRPDQKIRKTAVHRQKVRQEGRQEEIDDKEAEVATAEDFRRQTEVPGDHPRLDACPPRRQQYSLHPCGPRPFVGIPRRSRPVLCPSDRRRTVRPPRAPRPRRPPAVGYRSPQIRRRHHILETPAADRPASDDRGLRQKMGTVLEGRDLLRVHREPKPYQPTGSGGLADRSVHKRSLLGCDRRRTGLSHAGPRQEKEEGQERLEPENGTEQLRAGLREQATVAGSANRPAVHGDQHPVRRVS